MNYRKIYKEHYKISFGTDFEIHHIDGNRNHNDIRNLLLLPKALHRKYHNAIQSIAIFNGAIEIDCSLAGNSALLLSWQSKKINEIVCIMEECQAWIGRKSYDDMKLQLGVNR